MSTDTEHQECPRLTRDEMDLVWYALRQAGESVDRQTLADLGLCEIDPHDHGDEDSGFTDALLDQRERDLEGRFRRLAALFERPDEVCPHGTNTTIDFCIDCINGRHGATGYPLGERP